MGVRLVVRSRWSSEERSELTFEFDQARIVIGRSSGADVCIPHQAVSTQHASIRAQGAGYVLHDEGSTNGTRVNSAPLYPGRPKALNGGDHIELGGFVIEFQGAVAVARATTIERTSALARRMVREAVAPTSARIDEPRLLVINGPQEGTVLPVPPPPTRLIIGRADTCDLALVDVDVSREHAEVARDLDGVTLRDFDSKNGLLVNERPMASRRLRDRDQVRIGNTVMVFEDPAEEAVRGLLLAPDVRVELPVMEPAAGDAGAPGAPDGRAIEADSAGGDAAARTALRSGSDGLAKAARGAGRRGMASPDVVIYVLAAAVLALSVAGLLWLLQSG